MEKEKKKKRDWVDLVFKAMTPVFAGLLIAWAGYVSNKTLSSISSKQESARLITELQIKREQAEMVLRKDVFDKTLQAFLLKNATNSGTLKSMSKQLLRLELLALNFGDSLSLSPLFVEVRNDLDKAKPVEGEAKHNYSTERGDLRKRLVALAKRVASAQISSLAQHGKIISIPIPLYEYKQIIEKEDEPCGKILFEDRDFAWPDYKILKQMGVLDSEYQSDNESEVDNTRQLDIFKELVRESGLIELNGIKRYLRLYVSDVDHCKKTAEIQIILVKDDPDNPEVDKSFRLDYFNFPMVDNTRLSENHRFAIIMDTIELEGSEPHIDIIGIVFPSEYASLRDRPGMLEARKLLESALKN